jgi:hypothetical protein
VIAWFQAFAFKCSLYRYAEGVGDGIGTRGALLPTVSGWGAASARALLAHLRAACAQPGGAVYQLRAVDP